MQQLNTIYFMRLVFYMVWLVVSLGCTQPRKLAKSPEPALSISSVQFLDKYVIPFDLRVAETWVGGLSGIDYDSSHNRYFIISDERSATRAARFYTAEIDIHDYKIDTIRFVSATTLKNPRRDTFPSLKARPEQAADPESIRYNPYRQTLVWSSEGDKNLRSGQMVYQQPYVYEMDLNGFFKDSFSLPANLLIRETDSGSRENGVFEGVSFSPDYQQLWVSMESPIYEDGPLASPHYPDAPVRFTVFDAFTKKPLAQYGYLLDAVARTPVPASAFSVNGVSEILDIGNHRLLVLERSFSAGNKGCVVSLYLADFNNASNILKTHSLYDNSQYRPAVKKLLMRLNDLGTAIDNVEGISLGPRLPNGHYSLLLIADNNFNPGQEQQVFLLEIIP